MIKMKKTRYKSFEEALRSEIGRRFRGEENKELDHIILDAPLEEEFVFVWSPHHTGIRSLGMDKMIKKYYEARGFKFVVYDDGNLEWEKDGKRYLAFYQTEVLGDTRDDHRVMEYIFFEVPNRENLAGCAIQ